MNPIIEQRRKSIQIFTPDKQQLRDGIMRSGERALALDLLPTRARRYDVRQQVLRSVSRGREFARRMAHVAMRSWRAAFIKPRLKITNEIGNEQTTRSVRASVL